MVEVVEEADALRVGESITENDLEFEIRELLKSRYYDEHNIIANLLVRGCWVSTRQRVFCAMDLRGRAATVGGCYSVETWCFPLLSCLLKNLNLAPVLEWCAMRP